MKRFIILFLLLSAPAFAADKKPELTKEDCQMLVAHQARADVEYKPGADVLGKPVIEADLNPSVIKPPKKVDIPLTIDVAPYASAQVPAGTEMQANMGVIGIENNKVTFNGKPVEGDAEAALRALCTEKPPLLKDKKNTYNQ